MSLDRAKLHNVKPTSEGWQAGCPVCRAAGRDSSGEHLRLWRSGRWSCVLYPGDEEHNRGIWSMAGDGSGTFVAEEPMPTIEMPRTWPTTVLDRLVKDHSYWTKRGIDEAVIASMRGGVATEAQMKDRYVIPIFNEAEEIIGFCGRALRAGMEPRYKHLGKVSQWLWGGMEEIHETGQAVLVEGCGCRLALASHDVPQSLVLWGTNLSQAILGALIAANPKDIVVATNNESTGIGQRAAAKIKAKLDIFFDEGVVRIGLPLAKDFPDHTEAHWTEWKSKVLLREPEIPLDTDPKTETLSP